MSDQWNFFPCQMGAHRASVFYDHGVRDSIDTAVPGQLLKVRVRFKNPGPNGLPTSAEFDDLMAFEDGLQTFVQPQESVYVGRVTVDGHRHFYIYTSDSEKTWSAKLRALAEMHGYEIGFSLKSDDKHQGYWQELFPTDDDWQVIQDLRVIEALTREGDDGTATRCIDHWAFLPSQSGAEQFSKWAQERGYKSLTTEVSDDGKFRVRFSHDGTVRLEEITTHTITLRRKVSELGGEYDGWETEVSKASA